MVRKTPVYLLAGIALLAICTVSGYMMGFRAGRCLTDKDKEELRNEEQLLFSWVNFNIMVTVNQWLRASIEEDNQLYNSYLVFDTELKTVYFEKVDGTFIRKPVELPAKYDWRLYHITPSGTKELTDIIRLKNRADRQNHYNIYKEAFVLQTRISGDFGIYFILKASRSLVSGTGVRRLDGYSFNDKFYEQAERTVNESALVSEEEYFSNKI